LREYRRTEESLRFQLGFVGDALCIEETMLPDKKKALQFEEPEYGNIVIFSFSEF